MKSLFNETKSHWRMVKRKKKVINFCASVSFISLLSFSNVQTTLADDAVASNALPVNPVTTEGSATHTYNGNNLDIGMGTSTVKDTYDSFNIGRDAAVNIAGGDVYVAKVKQSGGLSHIYGDINAPGIKVFLQNESGITFYGSSQVNVGSLVATTAKNLNGSTSTFTFSGMGDASVINSGNIIISNEGIAVLAAPYVENNGFIQANLGKIELASASGFVVSFNKNSSISYALTDESFTKLGVTNTGTLQAKSGQIKILAHTATDIIDNVVNLDGVVNVDSFDENTDAGDIQILSDGIVDGKLHFGDINLNDVKITANGSQDGDAGTISINGGSINFSDDAVIEAKSGHNANSNPLYEEQSEVNINSDQLIHKGKIDLSSDFGRTGKLTITSESLNIKDGSQTEADEANVIYENTVEELSEKADVIFRAKSIEMEDLSDNELSLGENKFTLQNTVSDGFIKFIDKNDGISSNGGDIELRAGLGGIDIGNLKTVANSGGVVAITDPNDFPLYGDIILSSNATPALLVPATVIGGGVIPINKGTIINPTPINIIGGDGQITNITLVPLNPVNTINISPNTNHSSEPLGTGGNGDISTGNITIVDGIDSIITSAGRVDIEAEGSVKINGNVDIDSNFIRKINANANTIVVTSPSASHLAIAAGSDIEIAGDINLNNELVHEDSSYGVDASSRATLILESGGSVNIGGETNLASSVTHTKTENARSDYSRSTIKITAKDDVNTNGINVSSLVDQRNTQNAEDGSSFSKIDISSSEGSVNIDGNIETSSKLQSNNIAPTEGELNNIIILNAYKDIAINGDIKANVEAESTNTSYTGASNLDLNITAGNSGTEGGIDIEGDVILNSNAKYAGSKLTTNLVNAYFHSEDDINIGGDVKASAENIGYGGAYQLDYSSSSLVTASKNGGLNIDGDVQVENKSTNFSSGDIRASHGYFFAIAAEDIFIGGDVNVESESTNQNFGSSSVAMFSASAGSEEKESDIDILGGISVKTNSLVSGDLRLQEDALAIASINATGNILLSNDNLPKVQTNDVVLQQSTSAYNEVIPEGSTNYIKTAALALNAGGEVLLFDQAGFDQNENHYDTGTKFNSLGFDINGFNENGFGPNGFDVSGFDINGFNSLGIHRITGTKFNPLGFDINGNPPPPAKKDLENVTRTSSSIGLGNNATPPNNNGNNNGNNNNNNLVQRLNRLSPAAPGNNGNNNGNGNNDNNNLETCSLVNCTEDEQE